MSDWVCVYSTTLQPSAELMKGVLIHAGIHAVVVNKQDAAYKFGEYEVFVHINDELKARVIIEEGKTSAHS